MALIVEDGTAKADAESYADVAFADSYHSDRENSDWAGLGTSTKEAYLREATAFLEGKWGSRFRGSRSTKDQNLEFPRKNLVDSAGFLWGTDEIPEALKRATVELALRRASGELAPDQERGGQIRSVKAGSVSVQYAETAPASTSYPEVRGHLRRFLQPTGRVVRA